MKGSKYYIRITLLVLLLISTSLLTAEPAFAKRGEPAVIPDVYYKNLRITAENSTPENMGIVRAFDKDTDELVWSKKVYNVIVIPIIESDAQWVFISEMKLKKDTLVITNERNKVYKLNPMTGKERLTLFGLIARPAVLVVLAAVILFMILRIRKKRDFIINGRNQQFRD